MIKINIVLGIMSLTFIKLASATVCVHLSPNTLGNQARYEVTGSQGNLEIKKQTIISPHLKNNQGYFFLFKEIENLGALKVQVSMPTSDGELKLTCVNSLIRPLAKSALIMITPDIWDAGQCMMSTTPYPDMTGCRQIN